MQKDIWKTYQLQVRAVDGTYKSVIPPSLIMNQIAFSSQINWGQWQLTVKLNIPIDNSNYKQGDVIRVTCYDQNNTNGRVIYTGMLTRIKRTIDSYGEYAELVFVGLFSVLSRIIFKNGADYVFTLSKDPKEIIEDAIDYFNTIYTAWLFDTTELDTFGDTISIDFDYKKCNDVLSAVQKITNDWFFYVGADWKVHYKDTNGTLTNHRLKFENQVASLEIEENIEASVNSALVDASGTIYGPYLDSTSITEYGKIEQKLSWTDISTIDTADTYGNSYILENKDISKQTTIVVNSKYDIESINPWDTIQLLNTNYPIPRMIITKVSYTYDRVTLSLNRYDTLASSVLESNN